MLDPMLDLDLAQTHASDLRKAADQDRLARLATADAPQLLDRIVLRIGRLLVSAGLRLHAWQQRRQRRRLATRTPRLA